MTRACVRGHRQIINCEESSRRFIEIKLLYVFFFFSNVVFNFLGLSWRPLDLAVTVAFSSSGINLITYLWPLSLLA